MSCKCYFPMMKQLMEQYFLLLNGKRAMTGNIRVGANRFETSTLSIRETISGPPDGRLSVAGKSPALYLQDFEARSLFGESLYTRFIKTKPADNILAIMTDTGKETRFESNDGVTSRICIELKDGFADIPRAGDTTGLAGKTLDFPLFKVGGVAGVDGSFTTVDGKTVTVSKGLITNIV